MIKFTSFYVDEKSKEEIRDTVYIDPTYVSFLSALASHPTTRTIMLMGSVRMVVSGPLEEVHRIIEENKVMSEVRRALKRDSD